MIYTQFRQAELPFRNLFFRGFYIFLSKKMFPLKSETSDFPAFVYKQKY